MTTLSQIIADIASVQDGTPEGFLSTMFIGCTIAACACWHAARQ